MDEILNNSAVEQENDVGSVTISDEVVAVIAGVATAEVKGVSSMSGTLAGGIAEILGKKNMGKGVKVTIDGDTTRLICTLQSYTAQRCLRLRGKYKKR